MFKAIVEKIRNVTLGHEKEEREKTKRRREGETWKRITKKAKGFQRGARAS